MAYVDARRTFLLKFLTEFKETFFDLMFQLFWQHAKLAYEFGVQFVDQARGCWLEDRFIRKGRVEVRNRLGDHWGCRSQHTVSTRCVSEGRSRVNSRQLRKRILVVAAVVYSSH